MAERPPAGSSPSALGPIAAVDYHQSDRLGGRTAVTPFRAASSRGRDRADEPGRQRSFADLVLILLIENNMLAHADYGMISLGGRSGEVRKEPNA